MTYPSVVSAVVRALAAETINSAGGVDFEPKVQDQRVPGAISGKEESFLVDCWVFARMHSTLKPEHWRALVAQYSTHAERKRIAIAELVGTIQSPASARFINCCVVTWAYPKLPGLEGKRSTNVLPAGWYCMDRWSEEPVPERTQHRWKSGIRKELKRLVDEALVEVQAILDAEKLIACRAA